MNSTLDYVDAMVFLLQEELDILSLRVKKTEDKNSVSVAFAPPQSTLVDAPTSLASTEWRWITNGRFGAETFGNGTGVLAYYRPNTNEWISFDSGVAVII